VDDKNPKSTHHATIQTLIKLSWNWAAAKPEATTQFFWLSLDTKEPSPSLYKIFYDYFCFVYFKILSGFSL
jgi:hypothetical protein